ncbi:MAG: hypothetical protein KDB92_01015, partial [Chitinophagaceae bacterium]|nr:hypothetical protein [Chitinophagaceae bacterium]
MKKFTLIAFAIVLLAACKSSYKGPNGVSYKTPVQYNDYIINRQTDLLKKIMHFAKTSRNDLDGAEKLLDGYVDDAAMMVTEIKGMPPFKKDSSFRDAAINTFSFYKKALDTYYRDLIQIRRDTLERKQERLDSLVKTITKEEAGFDRKFQSAQREFARKNNMKLKHNTMQDRIKNI